jgi:hypothetical protein
LLSLGEKFFPTFPSRSSIRFIFVTEWKFLLERSNECLQVLLLFWLVEIAFIVELTRVPPEHRGHGFV